MKTVIYKVQVGICMLLLIGGLTAGWLIPDILLSYLVNAISLVISLCLFRVFSIHPNTVYNGIEKNNPAHTRPVYSR